MQEQGFPFLVRNRFTDILMIVLACVMAWSIASRSCSRPGELSRAGEC